MVTTTIENIYDNNNKLHIQYISSNGKIIKFIEYYYNGVIKEECYYKDNVLHNNNYPAIIEYYENGIKKREIYYKNGKLHNEKAPAIIEYDENKNIINQKFYLNGKQIDELTILMNI